MGQKKTVSFSLVTRQNSSLLLQLPCLLSLPIFCFEPSALVGIELLWHDAQKGILRAAGTHLQVKAPPAFSPQPLFPHLLFLSLALVHTPAFPLPHGGSIFHSSLLLPALFILSAHSPFCLHSPPLSQTELFYQLHLFAPRTQNFSEWNKLPCVLRSQPRGRSAIPHQLS